VRLMGEAGNGADVTLQGTSKRQETERVNEDAYRGGQEIERKNSKKEQWERVANSGTPTVTKKPIKFNKRNEK